MVLLPFLAIAIASLIGAHLYMNGMNRFQGGDNTDKSENNKVLVAAGPAKRYLKSHRNGNSNSHEGVANAGGPLYVTVLGASIRESGSEIGLEPPNPGRPICS